MKTTALINALRQVILPIALAATIPLSGCSSLLPKPTPQPTFYTLNNTHQPPLRTPLNIASMPLAQPTTSLQNTSLPVLIINPPHAATGFDSQRIIYVRTNHQLEYFAQSEWIDTPARMITPLLIAAIESSAGTNNNSGFSAVIATPSTAISDIRLDTEILRLQHNFSTSPSQVRFTVRAYLVDTATRKVLTSQEFDATVPAATEDTYGGVVAANEAVQRVLTQVAQAVHETGKNWSLAKQRAGAAPKP